jgi:DNA-binding NarL/FixJ family response regulator
MYKVILADNQAIFRAGIAKVLAVEDDMRIVAQTQTPEQMMMALEKFGASVLLCSAEFHPGLGEVLELANRVHTRALIIAENGDDSSKYLTLGAAGVVYRNIAGPALVNCVRKVASGETVCVQTAATREVADNDMVGARVRDRLTPKELRIVALIVQGFKNKEIATQLGTTEQVIKNYLRNIYDKIGVSDRLELALFTIHHRILAEAAAATANNPTAPSARSARAPKAVD